MPNNWNPRNRSDFERGQRFNENRSQRPSRSEREFRPYRPNDEARISYGRGNYDQDLNFEQTYDRDYSTFGRDSDLGSGYGLRENHSGRGPKGWTRSDERIKEDACEALERDPRVDASEIEVDVNEGIISLRGSVDDRRTKRRAEDCVEHLSGVKDVRNELSIDKSLFQRAKEAIMGEGDINAEPAQRSTSPRTRH